MPAKVIVVFNQKGGCCKTMTTMQIAGTLGLRGLKVFVIDMDPQNTAALWYHQADAEQPFPGTLLNLAALKEGFIDRLGAIVKNNDVVVIDCPPALESRVPWVALLASDFAIIPAIPVMDNVWASKQAEELVLEAMKLNPALRATYLLSQVRRGKVYEECFEQLKKRASLPIMNAKVAQRNVYPESQIYGCVVSSFGKSSAATEMELVTDELAKLVGLTFPKGSN